MKTANEIVGDDFTLHVPSTREPNAPRVPNAADVVLAMAITWQMPLADACALLAKMNFQEVALQ